MNVDVRVETVIHAPLADVAAYASDPSHAPEWYANISSVEWETPPPAQVGSRVAFVAHFLGMRVRPELRVRSGLAARVPIGQGDGVQRSGGAGLEAEEPALDGGG